jgi:hypothetical protein
LGIKPKQHFFQQSTTNFRIQFALLKINKIIKLHQPDMVIAERTTSYGFPLSSVKPIAIAQQGEQIYSKVLFYYQLKK